VSFCRIDVDVKLFSDNFTSSLLNQSTNSRSPHELPINCSHEHSMIPTEGMRNSLKTTYDS